MGGRMEKERIRNGGRPDLPAGKTKARADLRLLCGPPLACRKSRRRTRRQHHPGVPGQSSHDQIVESGGCVPAEEVGITAGGSRAFIGATFLLHKQACPPSVQSFPTTSFYAR